MIRLPFKIKAAHWVAALILAAFLAAGTLLMFLIAEVTR
jgi:hypothetical protein